jgi:hypothetical protein
VTAARGPWAAAAGLAITTAAAITLPLVALLAGPWARLPSTVTPGLVAYRAAVAHLVLAGVAVLWGVGVVRVVRPAPDRPSRVLLAAARTGVLLALPTAFAIDVTQLLLGVVDPWHRRAVHGLFTLAFAGGLAAFLGIVSWRVARALTRDGRDPARLAGVGRRVALATAAGVVAGSALALAIDWPVHRPMGREMLHPLYLVMVTGGAAGGARLAWVLRTRLDVPEA